MSFWPRYRKFLLSSVFLLLRGSPASSLTLLVVKLLVKLLGEVVLFSLLQFKIASASSWPSIFIRKCWSPCFYHLVIQTFRAMIYIRPIRRPPQFKWVAAKGDLFSMTWRFGWRWSGLPGKGQVISFWWCSQLTPSYGSMVGEGQVYKRPNNPSPN